MGDNSFISLLKRYFHRFELRKHRAVWLALGVDYDAEEESKRLYGSRSRRSRDVENEGGGG